jgi:hypothetical protein
MKELKAVILACMSHATKGEATTLTDDDGAPQVALTFDPDKFVALLDGLGYTVRHK